MEDRGESLFVWLSGSAWNNIVTFDCPHEVECPFPSPSYELSMPIGWRLVSTEQGAVVRNTFGKSLTASEAMKTFKRKT